jgi:hypothetical protein
MKNLMIICFTLFSGIVYSQIVKTVCDANYNVSSTDWSNPYNANLPQTNGNRYLNGTNWNQGQFPLPGMSFNNINLGPKTSLSNSQLGDYYSYIYYESPAHEHLPAEGWELLLINVGKYADDVTLLESNLYSALPYVILYNKFKGVIRVFVGMGPDADISNSADALSVELFFTKNSVDNNRISGLLRLYEGHDQALDQATDIKRALSVGKAVTELSRWASVDFQVAYDPCTCNTPSIMGIEFSHIREQDLSLYGREVAITDNDIMTNEMQVNPKEFLSSVNYDAITKNASEGLVISKALSNSIADYEARYQQYQDKLAAVEQRNEKINRNLAFLKFAKYAYAAASTLSGGLTSDLLPLILEGAGASYVIDYLASEDYNAWGTLDNDANWFMTTVNGVDGIIKKVNGEYTKLDEEKFFKKLKDILGEDTDLFISNNFEKNPTPGSPEQPTNSITYSEMKFEGKITTSTNKVGPTFFTPGTYGVNRGNTPSANPINNIDDVFLYPIYNEVLGTFALLNSPKINVSKSIASDIEDAILQRTVYHNNGQYSLSLYRYQAWTKNYQLQLVEPLKYVFNPTLDIKTYAIKAAYEVVVKPKNITTTNTYTISNSFVDPNRTVNIDILNVENDQYVPLIAGENEYHYGNGIPSPYYNFNIPLQDPIVHQSNIDLITPYLPLDAFKPFTSQFGIRNEAINARFHTISETPSSLPDQYNVSTLSDGSVYFNNPASYFQLPISVNPAVFGYEYEIEINLKLIVDIEFNSTNSQGLANKTTLALTYPIQTSDINYLTSDLVSNLATSNGNIAQWKENIFFENVDFVGQVIDGCKLNGTTYTCKALNNVNINGNLTTAPGYSVLITGGNEITVNNESIVSPTVTLSIESVYDYSTPMPLTDLNTVKVFCEGANGQAPAYQANQASARIAAMIEEQEAREEAEKWAETNWNFELFPNPTSDHTTIRVGGKADRAIGVKVTDIAGKEVAFQLQNLDETSYTLKLENCQKGIYFVTVSSYGGAKTKQLIVQ